VDSVDLERRLVLAYTGASRNSGINNWDVMKRHIDGDRDVFDRFERIRDVAVAMRDALVRGDWPEVGRQVAAEWDNRKALAPACRHQIDALIAGPEPPGPARGLRAGGGGCLFCFCSRTRPRPCAALAGRCPRADFTSSLKA
jgi:D-glycero-alpha-D-manno-heptose-7-phosphate kinase